MRFFTFDLSNSITFDVNKHKTSLASSLCASGKINKHFGARADPAIDED